MGDSFQAAELPVTIGDSHEVVRGLGSGTFYVRRKEIDPAPPPTLEERVAALEAEREK
jgi:hypothetical protein